MRTGRAVFVALLAAVLLLVVATGGAARPRSPQSGDSKLFDTWTGYETGRFLEAVVSVDLNGDGRPDAAWARQDWAPNGMQVQLNLGDGTLGPTTRYPSQSHSNDIAAGDLDRDGDPDLVVISSGDNLTGNVIDLYFNSGNGTFTHTTATGGRGATRLALADLDGDADLDLALANYWSQTGDVSVLLNDGHGAFGPETAYGIGNRPQGIVAADLDGDGDRDLAVAHESSPGVELVLLRNEGAGAFSQVKTMKLSVYVEAPVVVDADWDRDGDRDLAVGGARSDKVVVLKNVAAMTFTEELVPGGFTSFSLRAVDVDADGDTDILSPSYGSNTGELTLLRNNGLGGFGAPIGIEAGRNPHDVDVADFDGNGSLDLAVANRVTNTGGIHPQRPGGAFAGPPIFETAGQLPLSVATADFDRDGDVDVAEGSGDVYEDARVEILRNGGDGALAPTQEIAACTTCRADVVPYVRSVYAADLNGDGARDLLWAPDAPPYPLTFALNNGDGTFGASVDVQINSCGTGKPTTADVDNDGDQDVLVPNNRSGGGCWNGVRVLRNNGNATFQPDYGVLTYPLPEMVVGADVTGDGIVDVVTSSAQVSVTTGTGGGAFGQPVNSNARGTELEARDLDSDGDVDLVTSDLSTSSAYVLRNAGDGVFSPITNYPGEQVSGYANDFALDLGDLDGDGALDLVVANPSANTLGVHFGKGAGVFETQQVRYGVHGCLTDLRLADMNADGKLDVVGPACIGSSFVTPRGVTVLLNRGQPSAPISVALTALTATRTPAGVVVRWRTPRATRALGFNVWRSARPDEGYRRLNRPLVSARRFLDRSAAPRRAFYRVEAVLVDGSSAWVGPVRAR